MVDPREQARHQQRERLWRDYLNGTGPYAPVSASGGLNRRWLWLLFVGVLIGGELWQWGWG
ncbi:MAG: hypothetical protein KDI44_19495 [Thiothrix sp.]|nr:hypothetical protein [Thiothrix sp.]